MFNIVSRSSDIRYIDEISLIKTDFSIHDSTTCLLSINTPMFESQGTYCDGDVFIPTINYRQSKHLIIRTYRSTLHHLNTRERLWYTPRGLLLLFLSSYMLSYSCYVVNMAVMPHDTHSGPKRRVLLENMSKIYSFKNGYLS